MLPESWLALGLIAIALLFPIFLLALLMQLVSNRVWVRAIATAFIAALASGWFFGWFLDAFSSDEGISLMWTDRITTALPMMLIAMFESVLIVRLVSRHIDR